MKPLSQGAIEFVHGIYQHYKGNRYQTLFIARNSETLEELVVYQDMKEPEKVWCRPLQMFLEEVHIDGKDLKRFTKIN